MCVRETAARVLPMLYPRWMTKAAFDVPPNARGPDNLQAWFTAPPGVLVRMVSPTRGTKEMAEWLVGPGFALLRARFPDEGSLVLVLDFSKMLGRDSAARVVMMDKAREARQLFARTFVIPPAKSNPVYMTTLYAAAALLTGFGIHLVIARSLDQVLAQCPLEPAGAR
jgi:hypothetical protein